jgi:hypothetical protein
VSAAVDISDAAWIGWIDVLRWTQALVLFCWLAADALRAVGPRRLVLGVFAVVATVVVLGQLVRSFRRRLRRPENRLLNLDRSRATGPFFAAPTLAGFLVLVIPGAAALLLLHRPVASSASPRTLEGVGIGASKSRRLDRPRRWRQRCGSWPRRELKLEARLARFGARCAAADCRGNFAAGLVAVNTRGRFEQMVIDRGEVSRPVLWRAASGDFQNASVRGHG